MKTTALFFKIMMAYVALSYHPGFAQTSLSPVSKVQNTPNEKIVTAYDTSFEKKVWNSMEQRLF